MTPFARLLIFLIIFLPLAYLAAAYINGEDGIANVKRMVGLETAPRTEAVDTRPASDAAELPAADRVARLEREIQQLEQELADRKAELRELQRGTEQ